MKVKREGAERPLSEREKGLGTKGRCDEGSPEGWARPNQTPRGETEESSAEGGENRVQKQFGGFHQFGKREFIQAEEL